MKKTLLLFFLAVSIVSCQKERENRLHVVFDFYPKKVRYVVFDANQREVNEINGFTRIEYNYVESVSGDDLALTIFTTNVDRAIMIDPDITQEELEYYYFLKDEPLPRVEAQIREDYCRQPAPAMPEGSDNSVFRKFFYRTTEIRGLTLTALNTPLFGRPAGESLNDCFRIENYDPPIIVSAPTETLIYGYSSKSYPETIGEWLSLNPLSSVCIALVPTRKITGLPLDVQFVVQMQTADGTVLRDTTQMIRLTP